MIRWYKLSSVRKAKLRCRDWTAQCIDWRFGYAKGGVYAN